MAQVNSVNYEMMPNKAREMRENARTLNQELKKVYSSLEEMHTNWYGKRYNELIKAFNGLIPQFNEILSLLVTKIPNAIETAANNYAMYDIDEKITVVADETPDKLNTIALKDDIGMRYITENVVATKNEIDTDFKNVKSKLDEIAGKFGEIEWEAISGNNFKAEFTNLKASIENSVENVKVQFAQLMTKAEEEMEKTENANNIG